MMNQEEREKFEKVIADTDKAIKQYIDENGVEYPLDEWLTISEYCKKFNIPRTQVVTTWINRGVIPKKNVVTIPELNNLRLIKAIKYQE